MVGVYIQGRGAYKTIYFQNDLGFFNYKTPEPKTKKFCSARFWCKIYCFDESQLKLKYLNYLLQNNFQKADFNLGFECVNFYVCNI